MNKQSEEVKLELLKVNNRCIQIEEDSVLGKLLLVIKEYLEDEYDICYESIEKLYSESIENDGLIPFAHTTLEDNKLIHIDVGFDLANLKMVQKIHGTNSLVHEEYHDFEDLNDVIDELQWCDFNALIYHEASDEYLINTLIG